MKITIQMTSGNKILDEFDYMAAKSFIATLEKNSSNIRDLQQPQKQLSKGEKKKKKEEPASFNFHHVPPGQLTCRRI
jgi:hypothetical protein